MLRHCILQTQAAEPAIGEVQVHLLAQPPLRPDPEAVADDEHPDHELWVDRGAPGMAVERREVLAQLA